MGDDTGRMVALAKEYFVLAKEANDKLEYDIKEVKNDFNGSINELYNKVSTNEKDIAVLKEQLSSRNMWNKIIGCFLAALAVVGLGIAAWLIKGG